MSDRSIDVSVVIPCYKAEAYLEICLASVLSQRDVTLEVIAIDDASPDGTRAILQRMAQADDRIVLHALDENGGQASARNLGIETARGTYVAFLDSDDYYRHDRALADWVARARADDLQMCAADYVRLTREDTLVLPSPLAIDPAHTVSVESAPQLSDISQCWQILYRRDFLDAHALRFSRRLRQREDRLFFVSCLLQAERVGNLGAPLVIYRAHDGSTMSQVTRDQLDQFSLHLQLLAEAMDAARPARPSFADFETANAARYWRQGFVYWRPVLETGVGIRGKVAPFARDFFLRLHALTRTAGPLFAERHSVNDVEHDGYRAEATLDIARLAVAQGRWEDLARLYRGDRLHLSELRALAEASDAGWATDAVTHYLRFNRAHDFPQNRPTAATPALSDRGLRVILHIGMPKTGSSAMQEFLERNRLALLDRGIWYPDIGVERGTGVRLGRTGGHAILVQQALGDPALPEIPPVALGPLLSQQVAALGREVHTILLSAENVLSDRFLRADPRFDHPAQVVEVLARSIGVPDLELWATLRRPDHWFHSYYRELMCNPFNDLLIDAPTAWARLRDMGLFDYDAVLDRIAALPGVGTLRTVGTGRMRAEGGSVDWMLSQLGVTDTDGLRTDLARANESFSDAMAVNFKILKMLNLPRMRAVRLFSAIAGNDRLRASQVPLISSGDWLRFQTLMAPQLAAYDARFPGETPLVQDPARDALPVELDPVLQDAFPVGLLPPVKLYETLTGTLAPTGMSATMDDIRSWIFEREELRRSLDYLRSSLSWRVTLPLRVGLRGMRRLRGRR